MVEKACRDGDIGALKKALGDISSYDINKSNEEGLCPIHIAILYNDAATTQKLIEELIRKGADINLADKRSGDSMLHLCLSFKTCDTSRRLVPFLLRKGCSGLIKNYAGKSALDVAKDNGYLDLEQLIREYQKSKHILNYYTPPIKPNVELPQVEDETHEDVNSIQNKSLIEYIKLNDFQNIKKLLEEGADANFNEKSTYMPIHYAVSKSRSDPIPVLELLQSFNAQIDSKTEENDSVLTLAIKKIETEELCFKVVEYLKGCGVSITETDNDGYDAVTLARLRHFYSVVNILSSIHDFDGPYHPIHKICRNKNLNKDKKVFALENPYFKNNVSVDLKTKLENETCLHIACRNNDEELVKFLLSKNATIRIINKNGDTALSITRNITRNATIERLLIEADQRQNPQVEERPQTKTKVEDEAEKEAALRKKGCNIL